MTPISSDADYERTREYVARLQQVILEMRRTHTPSQYEWMSRSYLREMTKDQQEIAEYLAAPLDTDSDVDAEPTSVTQT